MASDVIGVNQLLVHIKRNEMQFWSLIDAQHELKSRFDGLAHSISAVRHPLMDSIGSLLSQYEASAWQIVPIQLHLRLKLIEFSEIQSGLMIKQENMETEIDEEMENAVRMNVTVMPIDMPEEEDKPFNRLDPPNGGITINNALSSQKAAHPPCWDRTKSLGYITKNPRALTGAKPFKCQLCDATFGVPSALRYHKLKHIEAGDHYEVATFECEVCQMQFKQKRSLNKHARDSHGGTKLHACNQCDDSFKSTEFLYRHQVTKHGSERRFGCDICQRRFITRMDLIQHMKTHIESRVECSICGKSAKNEKSLRAHIKATHTIQKLLCDECGKGFPTKSSLELHMVVHSGERPFACTECDFRTGHASALRKHTATHSVDRPFKCLQCDKAFGIQTGLHEHMRGVHPTVKPFQCTFCSKAFVVNCHLQAHLLRHTGVKPYPCAECGEPFRSYTQRALHIKKVHTGELPHQCDICRERFLTKAQVASHMIKHTGIKPFECAQCAKRFATKYLLKSHQQIHHSDQPPVFKCDICLSEFNSAGYMERHKRCHTGERPFSCKVCDKTFADNHSVKVHLRVHTGEMPYACNVCGRRFRDNRNLGKHKKIHDKGAANS